MKQGSARECLVRPSRALGFFCRVGSNRCRGRYTCFMKRFMKHGESK